jgi:predicted methyltransferase
MRRGLLLPFVLVLPFLVLHPPAATTPAPPASHDATAHEAFTDVNRWVRIFDDPGRDAWQKPAEVAAALGLRPGAIVADLGAGTGYFERALAKTVGPDGLVLAIDTEPKLVEHLRDRIRTDLLEGVLPVLAAPDDPFLPRGRVDAVLVVDTYHHIDDRLHYFRALRGALAPGGRVAVVDYHKKPLPVGPPLQHKLAREFVVDEMKQAGYALTGEQTFLPYQYFLLFSPAGR